MFQPARWIFAMLCLNVNEQVQIVLSMDILDSAQLLKFIYT